MRDALGLLTTFGRRGGVLSSRSLLWFPVIGAALGAIVGGAWWVADRAWSPLPAAVIVVIIDLAVTGMLHVDGLADSADGLLPHATRERRLEIMRTPDVGAFGVTVVAVTLLVSVAALSSQPVSVLLVVALWCAARALVAVVPSTMPAARPGGMGAHLVDGATRWTILALPAAIAVGAWGAGWAGAAGVTAGVLAGIAVLVLAARRIGGFTGDVLGATIVLTETVGLLVAAARW
ncbi:MAG TPA: adenosylcobinamide-GDP ribazoletransferase [Acidimicrobiia bacterium]|nr:adenosylcobinamide-GDP ribazoletransferase [Acidimicrobiia bacterium]